jgi:hypothetical protein
MQLGGKQGSAVDARHLLWRFLHISFLVPRGYVLLHVRLSWMCWVAALQEDLVATAMIDRYLW